MDTQETTQEITQEVAEQQPPVTVEQQATQQDAELSDEQFLAIHNKRFGTEYKSIDELKPKAAEPTDVEKAKLANAREKILLEKHIAKGGTIDDFTALKSVLRTDLKELSITKTKNEYLKLGLTEEEAENEIKKRYYQLSDDELEFLEEEEKAGLLKKKDIFSKKLHSRASVEQANAKAYFDSLERELENEQYELEVDNKLAAEAQVIAKTFDRKVVTQLEMKDGVTVPPIESVLSDDDMADIANVLGDKQKREALLYREDGTENLAVLAELLSYKKRYDKAVKAAAYAAMTATVEHTMARLPNSPVAVQSTPSLQRGGRVTSVNVYGGNS
jgi:hypothetical protein